MNRHSGSVDHFQGVCSADLLFKEVGSIQFNYIQLGNSERNLLPLGRDTRAERSERDCFMHLRLRYVLE